MIFNTPLPNDLLRNPPWPQTMITWPVNDAFLSIIAASEEKLKDIGYYLKYGIEINLGLMSPSEAKTIQNAKGSPTLWSWRRSCNEQFSRDISEANLATQFSTTSSEVYSKLEDIAEQHGQHPTPESETWLSNWALTQSFYQRAQSSLETKDNILAKKNFMIAALHLLPQHLGGLDGLIEQRFASEHYGYGWWDGKDILELRTLPTQGYESTIANYHHILWRLKMAVSDFGFVPIVANGMAQSHFSLWQTSNNKNIMASNDDESLLIRTKLADGIFQFIEDYPVNKFSRMFSFDPIDGDPFIGSSRISILRTCDDNWELRLPHVPGVTHLARDIFLISSITSSTMQPEVPLSAEEKRERQHNLNAVNYLFEEMLHAPSSGRSAESVRRLVVAADPPRVACPFISCLEGAIIGENNELLVPRGVIQWNQRMLHKTIGRHGINLFSTRIEGKTYSLESIIGWQEFFRKIRVTENRSFDTASLHPLLAKHFHGLAIGSIITDLHMRELKTDTELKRREFSDLAKAHLLAEGLILRFGENLLPAQKEIFGFLLRQNTMLDAEDTAPYLLTLYEGARKFNKGIVTKPSLEKAADELASSKFLLDWMGLPIFDAIRYRGTTPASWPSCFENHHILAKMIATRESILLTLPNVAKVDPPKSNWFFHRFASDLDNPDRLYKFDTVATVFATMSLMHGLWVLGTLSSPINRRGILQGTEDAEDRAELGKAMMEVGETVAISMVNLIAAAQPDIQSSTIILDQYSSQASTLMDWASSPSDKEKDERVLLMQFLSLEFMLGAQTGIVNETQRLKSDAAPITNLRQKVAEGLHL